MKYVRQVPLSPGLAQRLWKPLATADAGALVFCDADGQPLPDGAIVGDLVASADLAPQSREGNKRATRATESGRDETPTRDVIVTFVAPRPTHIAVDPRADPTRSHYRDVLRFVRRRVDSTATAEDVTQEVFANAAESLARSADAVPPNLGWLYTVARRRLVDEARRRRVPTVPLEVVLGAEAPPDEYGGLVARTFELALARLPEAQRRVVLMRLVEGRTFGEIREQVGATEEACRMRFMRGLEQLRVEFEKEGLNP